MLKNVQVMSKNLFSYVHVVFMLVSRHLLDISAPVVEKPLTG